jgi:hypothetical protein
MKKSDHEQALVRPPKGGKMIYKQSRFSHLAPVPFRCLAAGRSGSGKTSALYSAVVDHYRACFSKIVIIARTAHLDHSYVQLQEWAAKHLRQDNREEPFVFTGFEDEGALMDIFNVHAAKVAKEKQQRKEEHSSAPLSSILWIIDDLSDSHALRSRNESVLNKVFTTGRHSGQSVWLNCHALSAVGTLLRKNASCLLVWKISAHSEYEMLADNFAHLVGGKEAFRAIYEVAVVDAPPFSFLTILPHEQDPDKMFLARFDEHLVIEDD